MSLCYLLPMSLCRAPSAILGDSGNVPLRADHSDHHDHLLLLPHDPPSGYSSVRKWKSRQWVEEGVGGNVGASLVKTAAL